MAWGAGFGRRSFLLSWPGGRLNVEVDGTRIIVTMPGTSFWVTYQKKSGNQHLVLIGSWVDPP